MKAIRTSWKTLNAPEKREKLNFSFFCPIADFEKIENGLVPEAMEDKWFIYFEDDWLFLHRSWTGHLIFWLEFKKNGESVSVVDSWVNRVPDQYLSDDVEYDRQMVRFLIDALLLGKKAEFPITKSQASAPDGLMQHAVAGTANPEKIIDK